MQTKIYLINTCNSKGVKIRIQATRDGVQFNFVPLKEVPLSYTFLGNTSKFMMVSLERTNQISSKSYASIKLFEV